MLLVWFSRRECYTTPREEFLGVEHTMSRPLPRWNLAGSVLGEVVLLFWVVLVRVNENVEVWYSRCCNHVCLEDHLVQLAVAVEEFLF